MKKKYLPLEVEILLLKDFERDICAISGGEVNDDKDGDWGFGNEMPFD